MKNIQFRFIINASFAVFITYLCMYAFRKPFTAASYKGLFLFGIDYKVVLIIFQLIGYTISKTLGIKFVSELKKEKRVQLLLLLLSFALISLLFFALVPYPYNALFLFFNGLPLGMIWGVVFSFIEGRRSTELLGAIMASSFIVSSGIVKTSGVWVLTKVNSNEMEMPFITALLYIPLLIIGIFLLQRIQPPTIDDHQERTERIPMNSEQRKKFFHSFYFGIILSILMYVLLTIFRDMRDNFAIEFWNSIGYHQSPEILTLTEIPVAVLVMLVISVMIFIKDNKIAFYSTFWITLLGGILLILTSISFYLKIINGTLWMIITGFSMYLPYIAFHSLFFERWIAYFKYKSNTGYLMSMADTAGYLGSTFILLIKSFATPDITWSLYFTYIGLIIGIILIVITISNYYYFNSIE